jgi:hypothetical protein
LRVGPSGEEIPVVIHDGIAHDLSVLVCEYDASFWSGGGIEEVKLALAEQGRGLPRFDLSTVRVGPPITRPGKVVCIGLNYMGPRHRVRSRMFPSSPLSS